MNSNYPHPLIAREGWPYLAGIAMVSLCVEWGLGFLWALPFWVLTLFVLQFFRDPPRLVPVGEQFILSPADGRIVAIMPVQDPWLQRPAVKVSVFMNVFNVHSNRSPVHGKVRHVEYHPGLFVNADLDKASEANERNAVILDTPHGALTCVQVAGLIARRILCYVVPGSEVSAGERYGFIRFGSRVDLYLPPEVRIRVALGDVVKATTTVVAEWPEPGTESS
ncbi:MAG: phosphatidylserine decarboxylase [Ferrovum sp.]|uniref:phosphatidylserine decarboxylase n=1 Tax=Ferrovum sp. TaxID=2609467 RepID=UPI00261D9AC0|nr:phosphatidylserine decarboxylase [Ferrovum sp.]MBW8067899.1 phosphatidylserine decarboxylase [Ferrovum sp.]